MENITMYEARHSFNEIRPIKVIRYNAMSYWTDKGRRARMGNYDSVWLTFDEAREFLKARLERKISIAQSTIDTCKNSIKKLNLLQHI